MLQIEIDGKLVEVAQGSNIIEAAHQIGTYIPHFCYHKKLSIAANCRMCLVEVEKAPKPLPACATPVTDGMKVKTTSSVAKNAQRGVMEFLLINHPLDCPICDQGGECQLQDLAVGYGKSESRFQEEKHVVIAKDMGPLVSAEEMSRCIHCTRCVRFTEEIAGFQEIGMAYRGEHSEIMPFIGKAVTSEVSGNVIDLCPVGALTSKPFRYTARPWELSRRKSISVHDSLGSNLIVQTKAHKVMRVLPLENEEINECWLSDRDRFSYEGLNHADRLHQPMIKQDGKWHCVDWEVAFAYVLKGLQGVTRDYGVDSLGVWVNPQNTLEELYLIKKIAQHLGIKSIDSRLHQQDSQFDKQRQGVLWLGQSIEDFAKNQAVLVIGAELRSEQPLLTTRLRRATVQDGMKLSILHSRKEVLHMPVVKQLVYHPQEWGTQLQTLIANIDTNPVSGSLKQAKNTSIILGASVQQSPQFSEIYALAQQLAQATESKLGILPMSANSLGADLLSIRPDEGGASIGQMYQHTKKAIMLVNVEPDADVMNASLSVRALADAETVIALTAYQSDTLLEVADVLLPIVPFSETSGSLINMEGRLQSFYGVVQAQGEARPLWKVLRVLGNRLEVPNFNFNSSQEILEEIIDSYVIADKLDNQINFKNRESLQGTKQLWRTGGTGLYDSDAIVRRASSLQKTVQASTPKARLHSKTLAELGVSDGDVVFAKNGDSQSIELIVQADDTLAENTVFLPTHKSNYMLGAMMNTIELQRK